MKISQRVVSLMMSPWPKKSEGVNHGLRKTASFFHRFLDMIYYRRRAELQEDDSNSDDDKPLKPSRYAQLSS